MPIQRLTRAASAFSATSDPNMTLTQAEVDAAVSPRELIAPPHAYQVDGFEFLFDDTLTGGQVTAFDAALAAHTGTPLADQVDAPTAPNGGGTNGTLVEWDANSNLADSGHAGASDPHSVYQLKAQKGANNGYPGLDGSGRVVQAVQVVWTTADGGTALVVGDVADGEALVRDGTTLIGGTAGGGAGSDTYDAGISVTEPHSIRNPASSVRPLRHTANVTKLVVSFGADTDGSGGSFTFKFLLGPIGGSLTDFGDVTILQGTQTASFVVSSVGMFAGWGLVIQQTAVGAFGAAVPNELRRASCMIEYQLASA